MYLQYPTYQLSAVCLYVLLVHEGVDSNLGDLFQRLGVHVQQHDPLQQETAQLEQRVKW